MSDLLMMKECVYCNGTGNYGSEAPPPGNLGTCPICLGDGEIQVGNMKVLSPILSDIQDKLNDVMDKCNDIFEQVTGG